MIFRPKKPAPFIIISIIAILIGLFVVFANKPKLDESTVVIVVAPKFEDAVYSLGGLLAQQKHPEIVASFFDTTISDAVTTSLNKLGAASRSFGYEAIGFTGTTTDEEAELDLAQDIQALLASQGDKKIVVYGPSLASMDDHNAHTLFHAFMNVAESYPNDNVTFYVYEDYPAITEFTKKSPLSLIRTLEDETGRVFEQETISLTAGETRKKQKALEALSLPEATINSNTDYTKERCGDIACEAVFKLFRI